MNNVKRMNGREDIASKAKSPSKPKRRPPPTPPPLIVITEGLKPNLDKG